MASLDALQTEVKENTKVSNQLWRREVSQPWAGGTANSNPFHHRHPATAHGPGRPEPEWLGLRAESVSRAGTVRKRDTSSPTTAQRREYFLHAEDCLLTSFPSPCRSSPTTKPPARPYPAQAHQSLLSTSAQEEQLRRVLQNNSAGIGISSPLEHPEIWTLASHALRWVLCYWK